MTLGTSLSRGIKNGLRRAIIEDEEKLKKVMVDLSHDAVFATKGNKVNIGGAKKITLAAKPLAVSSNEKLFAMLANLKLSLPLNNLMLGWVENGPVIDGTNTEGLELTVFSFLPPIKGDDGYCSYRPLPMLIREHAVERFFQRTGITQLDQLTAALKKSCENLVDMMALDAFIPRNPDEMDKPRYFAVPGHDSCGGVWVVKYIKGMYLVQTFMGGVKHTNIDPRWHVLADAYRQAFAVRPVNWKMVCTDIAINQADYERDVSIGVLTNPFKGPVASSAAKMLAGLSSVQYPLTLDKRKLDKISNTPDLSKVEQSVNAFESVNVKFSAMFNNAEQRRDLYRQRNIEFKKARQEMNTPLRSVESASRSA